MLFPTSLVGSYPQPEWLIDRDKLSKQVPRVRADDLWLVAPDKLEAAQDDATILAVRDQERAGLDIITDGEQRRESYSNRFATALNRALDAVTGTVAVHLCFGYAAVVRDKPSGYSFLPELEQSKAQQISIEAAQPKLDLKILRELPSKTIVLGVIDLGDMAIETPHVVADRIRRALDVVAPERIVVAPDCGMKYLPRAVAFGKMKAMVEGAALVRRELPGT